MGEGSPAGPVTAPWPGHNADMNHWAFVFAAYAVVAAVLLGYWWRVERRMRDLAERTEERKRP